VSYVVEAELASEDIAQILDTNATTLLGLGVSREP
jgi:hypothetical protein